MKKNEKVLTVIFSAGIAAFLAAFLYRAVIEGIILDYIFFDTAFLFFSAIFAVSLLGLIPLLVNWRMRKRRELGKPPVSKLYTALFAVSLLPYLIMITDCLNKAVFGYVSFGTTEYGLEAVKCRLLFVWFYGLCCVLPVLPLLAYWQLIYIVSLIRTRLSHRNSARLPAEITEQ